MVVMMALLQDEEASHISPLDVFQSTPGASSSLDDEMPSRKGRLPAMSRRYGSTVG